MARANINGGTLAAAAFRVSVIADERGYRKMCASPVCQADTGIADPKSQPADAGLTNGSTLFLEHRTHRSLPPWGRDAVLEDVDAYSPYYDGCF